MEGALEASLREAADVTDAAPWRMEHRRLTVADLPPDRWRSLAMRRDLRALQRETPQVSFAGQVADILDHRPFHFSICKLLRSLDTRCGRNSQGLPMARVYGPWEGGIRLQEQPAKPTDVPTVECVFIAWNVRGALGTRGGCNEANVAKLLAFMHGQGAPLAILSDPQLGTNAPCGSKWRPKHLSLGHLVFCSLLRTPSPQTAYVPKGSFSGVSASESYIGSDRSHTSGMCPWWCVVT